MRKLLILLILIIGAVTVSSWKIVVPEAALNLITNPSFETGVTGWTASGSNTIAQSSDAQFAGNYALAATYQDNTTLASYAITLPTTNTTYRITGWLYVPSSWDGGNIRLTTSGFAGDTKMQVQIFTVGTDDFDKWLRLEADLEVATDVGGTLSIETASAPTAGRVVYLDAVQVEEKDGYATTYCDGDQEGCRWTGAAHGSTSSRPVTSRAGGRVRDLDTDYGLLVENEANTGMVGIDNIMADRSLVPGAEFQRSRARERLMILTANLVGSSRANYHAQRQALISAIGPDAVPGDQPVILQYEGAAVVKQIPVRYEAGLEIRGPQVQAETFGLRLLAADNPFWVALPWNSGNIGTTSATMRLIVGRVDGEWSVFGPPDASGTYTLILAILPIHDNLFYVAGDFENFDNIAAADHIAKYENGAWSSVGGVGASSQGRALAVDANGTIYLGGIFSDMGGDTDADYIAQWDGSSWSAVGVPNTGTAAITGVNAIAVHPQTGHIYVGGDFENFGGIANADRIAYWDGSSWNALGTGMNNDVETLAFDSFGNLYAGGAFTTAGGTTVNRVAMWDGSSWSSMNGGFSSNRTWAIAIAPNTDTIYASGSWTASTAGDTVNRVARWNGSQWVALGSGMDSTVFRLAVRPNGNLLASGLFTTAGGNTLSDSVAEWDGAAWNALPIDMPGSINTGALAVRGDDIFIGSDDVGTVYFSDVATITNEGTARAYPVVEIIHDGTGGTVILEQIENLTTGKKILFYLYIVPGARVVMDFRPGYRQMRYEFVNGNTGFGWAVLPGSDIAEFFLTPGDNVFAFYASPSAPTNITAFVRWQNAYASVD